MLTTPILAEYSKPSSEILHTLKQDNALQIVEPVQNIFPYNRYYRDGRPGTAAKMFTRLAVWKRLLNIAEKLKPHYGLWIFDAFRTIETQQNLFDDFYQQIHKAHPDWSVDQLVTETRRYVIDPKDKSRFEIPNHNSGGATDLAIYEISTGKVLDFGSEFDELSERSSTHFFEQAFDATLNISEERWVLIRKHRRWLFNLMKQKGFTNYHEEWWHYDLGDCLWAEILECEVVFDSLEQLIASS